jgi:hypothetical protein
LCDVGGHVRTWTFSQERILNEGVTYLIMDFQRSTMTTEELTIMDTARLVQGRSVKRLVLVTRTGIAGTEVARF